MHKDFRYGLLVKIFWTVCPKRAKIEYDYVRGAVIMINENKNWFLKGLRDGIPISLGYLAVSFTLGIAAKNAGFTAFQAMLTSLTNNASAGQFAGFTLVAAGAGYLELAVMELVANARYLLMSCAMSQKLCSGKAESLLHLWSDCHCRPRMGFWYLSWGADGESSAGECGTGFERGTLRNVSGCDYSAGQKKQGSGRGDFCFYGGQLCLYEAAPDCGSVHRYAHHSADGAACRRRGCFISCEGG